MTENIVTGKKYRILIDATADIWDRISFWTKASDVVYNDGSTVEENKSVNSLKRSTAYSVGSVAYEATAPSWVMLRCSKAGTTATAVPTTYSTITTPGSVITDGTAKFIVCDVRPSTVLSTNNYQVPAMSLVNDLNSELSANGKSFYFDYKNGKYGFNTSSGRGASTFQPFSNAATVVASFPTEYSCFANVNNTIGESEGTGGGGGRTKLKAPCNLNCHAVITHTSNYWGGKSYVIFGKSLTWDDRIEISNGQTITLDVSFLEGDDIYIDVEIWYVMAWDNAQTKFEFTWTVL